MGSPLVARELQQRIAEMQPTRLQERALPTPDALGPLFPNGALAAGSVVSVRGSWQLALSCISELSVRGVWCGVIGFPEFGAEAAAAIRIALDRCILVPDPGPHPLRIADTLSGSLDALIVRLPHRTVPHEAERLTARLRERGALLIAMGEWDRADARLRVIDSRWDGLGAGEGRLLARELTVESRDRRGLRTHTIRFERGRLAAAPPPRLRAVPA